MLLIRNATIRDLDVITAVEAACFSPAEAATRDTLADRLHRYPDHFWLLFEDETLVSFLDGFVTDLPDLTDDMFEHAELHDENGQWQMIFGVNTIPSRRRRGHAGTLIDCAIRDAERQGRKGVVLTCKDEMIPYYAKFGFITECKGLSRYAGIAWNQMRLRFD